MKLSKLLLFGLVFFSPLKSFGFLILPTDEVVIVKHNNQVHHQSCPRTKLEGDLPRDAEKVLKECKGATKQNSYAVPETAYHMSVNALYGIPTEVLDETKVITALTDSALAAEGKFRSNSNSPTPARITHEELFEKMSLSYLEILQYLGPELDGTLNSKDSIYSSLVRNIAIEAFTPYFSDGKISLHLTKTTLDTDNGKCRADTGLASLATLYEILSDAQTAASLYAWTSKQLKVDPAKTAMEIGSWQPMYEAKVTSDNRTGYSVYSSKLQIDLTEKTLSWFSENRERVKSIDWKAPINEVPGNGAVFFAAKMGGETKRNNRGQTYTEPATTYPVFCISRVQSLPVTVAPAPPGGNLGMTEIAAKYAMSPDVFYRWIISNPEAERLLAPTYIVDTKLTERDFEAKVRPVLDELMGVNLPSYQKLEAAAIQAEKERKAAELAEQKRQAEEAERRRLAAIKAQEEREEYARKQLQAEIEYYSSAAKSAHKEFNRLKSYGSSTRVEFCANSGYDISVYIAFKFSNDWGFTTVGTWDIPSFKCKTLYSGAYLGTVYYYAYEHGGSWSGYKDLVIQTHGDSVAVKADRTAKLRGEKVVGFKEYDGGSGFVWLNSSSATKYGQMHRSGDQVYQGAAPQTVYYAPQTQATTIYLVPVYQQPVQLFYVR